MPLHGKFVLICKVEKKLEIGKLRFMISRRPTQINADTNTNYPVHSFDGSLNI